jgi:hypothetical protein
LPFPRPKSGALLRALHFVYERTATGRGRGSAETLAGAYLRRAGGDREAAIRSLVAWHTAYAGTAGFLANAGGLVTLPFTIPANLSSVLVIQLRMVAAIAHLRGHSPHDPEVRSLSFLSLTGNSSFAVLQEIGLAVGTRLTAQATARLSTAALTRLNHAVGVRLLGQAAGSGAVNLTRLLPLLGGVAGAGFDAAMTRGIAAAALRVFPPAGEGGEAGDGPISRAAASPSAPPS